MKKYYKESILNAYNNLRNSLLAAISHFLGEENDIMKEITSGNVTLKKIIPVFNDRKMLLTKETVVKFEYSEDDLTYEKECILEDASLEWLITIYENLSGESIGR